MVSQAPIPDNTLMQTVGFAGQTTGVTVSLPSAPDKTSDGLFTSADDSLANFFKRPVLISTSTWTPAQASPFSLILEPWKLFFENPRVINRLNNYALMRSRLHVRFIVNGNPFYYGRLMADYLPLHLLDDVTDASTLSVSNAIQASQRMKVFIDPGDTCSCEMELPFVWYYDALSIPAAEWRNLGKIYVRELTGLKHANAATQPVTISVMAWATDVELAIPTSMDSTALVVQAGDEYTAGPVEKVATATASVASAISDIPYIGPYAKATSLMAGRMAKLAAVMGWSRPAMIQPHAPMRPYFISDLAPGDAGDNVSKLSVDSKQELSVDPNTFGANLGDELTIAGIAARESFLTSFPWPTTAAAGDLLWNSRVIPTLNELTGGEYHLPAMAFAVYPFQYWRGKIRYRFQIVASAYHKGRLRVVWDPLYVQSLESNVQITRVIDISEEKDVTLEIDWGQSPHYLPVSNLNTGATAYGVSAITSDSSAANGVLSLHVFNDLATPNSVVNNDIRINVFVSAVDLQVAKPAGASSLTNFYSATEQAGPTDPMATDTPGVGPAMSEHHLGVDSAADEEALVYFGERITNFRQLLRRYVLLSSYSMRPGSGTQTTLYSYTVPDTPVYYGYNSDTLHTAVGGTRKFNYVKNTIQSWLAPAFLGARGSQRTKYVATPSVVNQVGVMNVHRGSTGPIALTETILALASSQSTYSRSAIPVRKSGWQGAVTTPGQVLPVLEVEFPFYKPVRFNVSKVTNASLASPASPMSEFHTLEVQCPPNAAVQPIVVDRYVAVGEDFTYFWFQGCPPLTAVTPPGA